MIMSAATLESIRPLSNDERMGAWAGKYFSAGHHHRDYAPDDEAFPLAPERPDSYTDESYAREQCATANMENAE